MSFSSRPLTFGWLPDYPDFRDYTGSTPSVREALLPARPKAPGALGKPRALPPAVDLRRWCSPVEDQRSLGSCTANAGAGLIEYYERKAFGRHIDASRLFLYKATRNLMKHRRATRAPISGRRWGRWSSSACRPRSTGRIPTTAAQFDKEPPAFCYAFAQNYQTIQYYRHDPSGARPGAVLDARPDLPRRRPSRRCSDSPSTARSRWPTTRGAIPFPPTAERILGGHAVARRRLRRPDRDREPDERPGDQGRAPHPQFLGRGWGDRGATNRLRAGRGFLVGLKKEWVTRASDK